MIGLIFKMRKGENGVKSDNRKCYKKEKKFNFEKFAGFLNTWWADLFFKVTAFMAEIKLLFGFDGNNKSIHLSSYYLGSFFIVP